MESPEPPSRRRSAPGGPSVPPGRRQPPSGPAQGPPETPWQALAWQTTKRHYVAAGLCQGCAGQAAYGHQDGVGFRRVHPPCEACAGLVLPRGLIAEHGMRGQRWLDGGYPDPHTPR